MHALHALHTCLHTKLYLLRYTHTLLCIPLKRCIPGDDDVDVAFVEEVPADWR